MRFFSKTVSHIQSKVLEKPIKACRELLIDIIHKVFEKKIVVCIIKNMLTSVFWGIPNVL